MVEDAAEKVRSVATTVSVEGIVSVLVPSVMDRVLIDAPEELKDPVNVTL